MLSKKRISQIAFGVMFSLCVTFGMYSAHAATVENRENAIMGCKIFISGTIRVGDAQTVEDMLRKELIQSGRSTVESHVQRVCLDSRGGSMQEALRIARIIERFGWGTAVGPGHTCESACALAFMAGVSHGAEDGEPYRRINRILHPTARLGFHRPELIVAGSNYSASAVSDAFSVSMDAISDLVRTRIDSQYDFPDILLDRMLRTPANEMFYIETVGEAAGLSIGVISKWPDIDIVDAVNNMCKNIRINMRIYQPDGYSRIKSLEEIAPINYSLLPVSFGAGKYSGFEATTDGGFLAEGATSCVVRLGRAGVGYIEIGEYHIHDFGGANNYSKDGYYGSYLTFPYDFQLRNLQDSSIDWEVIKSRLSEKMDEVDTFCWLSSPSARITNVNEYVNLRRQPDFTAPVIREVPLGEQVRTTRADNITVIGQERDRQSCIKACQAFAANSDDGNARDRVQQCIVDNMLWYEINDARGNRGWVSRKFLEEVE